MRWRSSPPTASRWPLHRPSRSRRRYCASMSSSRRSSTNGKGKTGLSRALRRKTFDQQGVERVGIVGGAQLVHQTAITQQARDAGESLEVIGARAFRRQQQENRIDRSLVDRVEIDGMAEPREHADRLGQPGHAAVRDGDAAADAGRAEPLALQQTVEQATLVEAVKLRRFGGQLGQQGLLAGRLYTGQNGVWTG